jgi:hypothetical protein
MESTRRQFLNGAIVTGAALLVAPDMMTGSEAARAGVAPRLPDGPLGPLGAAIDYLMDPVNGRERRLAFADDPHPLLQQLPAGDREILRTLQPRSISLRVLQHVRDSGFSADGVRAYGDWLQRFAAATNRTGAPAGPWGYGSGGSRRARS